MQNKAIKCWYLWIQCMRVKAIIICSLINNQVISKWEIQWVKIICDVDAFAHYMRANLRCHRRHPHQMCQLLKLMIIAMMFVIATVADAALALIELKAVSVSVVLQCFRGRAMTWNTFPRTLIFYLLDESTNERKHTMCVFSSHQQIAIHLNYVHEQTWLRVSLFIEQKPWVHCATVCVTKQLLNTSSIVIMQSIIYFQNYSKNGHIQSKNQFPTKNYSKILVTFEEVVSRTKKLCSHLEKIFFKCLKSGCQWKHIKSLNGRQIMPTFEFSVGNCADT